MLVRDSLTRWASPVPQLHLLTRTKIQSPEVVQLTPNTPFDVSRSRERAQEVGVREGVRRTLSCSSRSCRAFFLVF